MPEVPAARHPVGQMTTSELKAYKRELLKAQGMLQRESPALASVTVQLDAVTGEQEKRRQAARDSGRSWPISN